MSKHAVTPESRTMGAEGHRIRRAALRAFIGIGTLAVPSIGSAASTFGNPIFTAIARHKAAYENASALSFAIDDLINNPDGRGVLEADWDAYDRATENEDAAFDELLMWAPETPAEMRAIIAHHIFLSDGRLSRKTRRLLITLLKSTLLIAKT